jgi:hypothetical protein
MAWCSQHRCLSVQHVSTALFRTSAQQSGQPAAAPDTFTYNAADSPYNYTYILRTEKVDCNQKGGHVVWYKDQGEQSDVDNYPAAAAILLHLLDWGKGGGCGQQQMAQLQVGRMASACYAAACWVYV